MFLIDLQVEFLKKLYLQLNGSVKNLTRDCEYIKSTPIQPWLFICTHTHTHTHHIRYVYAVQKAIQEQRGPRFFTPWATMNGSNEVLHMEHFKISSTESFFVVLYSNSSLTLYNIASSGDYLILQTLTVTDAASFATFEIDGNLYLAVARNSAAPSELYQWNASSKQFVLFNSIPTKGARDVEFVRTPRQGDYLIFACHYQLPRLNYSSIVYKWVSGDGEFQFLNYQNLDMASNALSVDSVVTNSGNVLLVVTHEHRNGNQNTVMYHWNGTYFDDRIDQRQVIPPETSTKTLLFAIGTHTFLVGLAGSDAHMLRYDRQSRQFVEYTHMNTPGVIDTVEYFHTSTEHFLVFANFISSQGTSSSSSSSSETLSGDHSNVLVYRIDGVGFKLFQEIQTSFRVSVIRHFSKGEDCRGIALASSIGMAELHQWADTTNHCS